ncbi:MAG: hypothetical protein ACYCTF_02525 [Acidiferrobacter sp.]
MRITSILIGPVLLWATVAAHAALTGSLIPQNACPAPARYCRAGAPESGLPRDYPPPTFLTHLRIQCTRTLRERFAMGPQTLLGPGFAPRLCRLTSAFLGATPGEWRAVIIAQMRSGNLKQTAAGRQLKRQIKAAVAAQVAQASTTPALATPRSGAGAFGGPRTSANTVIAARLHAVRVAMERTAMRRTGHPVMLPTGVCSAVLTLSPAGRVRQMKRLHCSNEGLQQAFWRAVFSGGPLHLLASPDGRRVDVHVVAPMAEPGVASLR